MQRKLCFLPFLLLFLWSASSAASQSQRLLQEVQIAPTRSDGVSVEYKEYEDKTWISSDSIVLALDSSETRRFSLHCFYITSGRKLIIPSKIYIGLCIDPCVKSFEFKMAVDGRVIYSDVIGSLCIAPGGRTYGLWSIALDYDEFLQILKAEEIIIGVEKNEFWLTENQKLPFLKFANYVGNLK